MHEDQKQKGKLVIISGPSGVGKTTICKEIAKRINALQSISMTTRPRAENEIDGEEYRFVSEEEFQKQIDQGLLLEYAQVFGNMYGTPKEPVDKALKEGKTIILQIDVQGAIQVKKLYPEALTIFILPPNQRELAHRMTERSRDTAETMEQRLDGASNEIAAAWQYYENMVINDELEQAISEVIQIINYRVMEKNE